MDIYNNICQYEQISFYLQCPGRLVTHVQCVDIFTWLPFGINIAFFLLSGISLHYTGKTGKKLL